MVWSCFYEMFELVLLFKVSNLSQSIIEFGVRSLYFQTNSSVLRVNVTT